jgi:hypothetical protein
MAADPTDLTTVAAVRSYLGALGQAEENEVQRTITAASAFIANIIHQPLRPTTDPLVVNGNGSNRLALRYAPVISVTSVKINGQTVGAATPGGVDSGWLLDRPANSLVLRGRVFDKGIGNVEVVYVSGYTTIPASVEQACLELVVTKYRERDRQGLASRSIGPESLSFAREEIPPAVLALVKDLKRVVPG